MTGPFDPWQRKRGGTGDGAVAWLGAGLILVVIGALTMVAENGGLLQ